jgi:hypothetical protein
MGSVTIDRCGYVAILSGSKAIGVRFISLEVVFAVGGPNPAI